MSVFNKELSSNDIITIFSTFIDCPNNNDECCDNCILNDNWLNGHRIGCLKLRDLAMQRVIEIFNKGDDNGKND